MTTLTELRRPMPTPESNIPVLFRPDLRPEPRLTQKHASPIANLLFDQFRPDEKQLGQIERIASPYLWPYALVLSTNNEGDASGLVLKTVGLCDKPEEVRRMINGICHKEFDKIDQSIQANINVLLREQRPPHLLKTIESLNFLVQSVNRSLDLRMTPQANDIRSDNSRALLEQTYSTSRIQCIMSTVVQIQDQRWYLIPHFSLTPKERDVNNRIVSVEQSITIAQLPDESVNILHRLTPPEFSTEYRDSTDPADEDFLARRLLTLFGEPTALATAAWVLETQEGKKLLADMVFTHNKYRPTKDTEPDDGSIY